MTRLYLNPFRRLVLGHEKAHLKKMSLSSLVLVDQIFAQNNVILGPPVILWFIRFYVYLQQCVLDRIKTKIPYSL